MGWLRLVGSLKLQVSFAEYSLFYRALLQTRPIILRSLLIVATPYGDDSFVSMIRLFQLHVRPSKEENDAHVDSGKKNSSEKYLSLSNGSSIGAFPLSSTARTVGRRGEFGISNDSKLSASWSPEP